VTRTYEGSSGYGRIQRGEMAADRYTQIANKLFRDDRISFKAKGIFGLISTHRDGYGVTPESLAADSRDGVSAVKSGLRELEGAGYLVRRQYRKPDGTMGPVSYFITDTPDDRQRETIHRLPPAETPQMPSSEPVDGNPPAVGGTHKKTNSKNPSENPSGTTLFPIDQVEAQQAQPAGDGFDDFWSLWPKKIDKAPARQVWASLMKSGEDAAVIVAFMARQAEVWKTYQKDPQYIPYPSTWLRKKRYQDDLDQPPANRGGHQTYRNPDIADYYGELRA
jgi:hypothetical protein